MKFLSLVMATGLAFVAAPLAAQQQAADVDAVAALLPPAPSLTVSVQNNLNFGEVRIPNASRGLESVRCVYQINLEATSFGPTRQVSTAVSETPTPGSGTISPSGCEFANSAQNIGLASIACIPGFEVDLTGSWLLGPQPNVFFRRGDVVTFGAFVGGSPRLPTPTGGGLITDGFTLGLVCPESGAVDILLGGWLEVGREANQSGSETVGRIQLVVNY